jgi:glycosyltransferase involved in cell wall biosynthesis
VTIVTTAFPPVGGGGVMRIAKLAKYLPDHGWDVTVVCSDEANPEIVDPLLLTEIPESVQIRRFAGPLQPIGGRAKRVTDAGSASRRSPARLVTNTAKAVVRSVSIPDRYLGWAWRIARLRPADLGDPSVILSSGPPHSAHLAAATLSRRYRIPLVMDLRDDWADNPMHANPAPWHGPIERRLERRCVKRAAAVVHVSDASRAVLAARYPGMDGRFHAITNGFDGADTEGLPGRVPVPVGSRVHFLYAGSLRGIQQVGLFLEVFGSSARARPGGLHLELVGPLGPSFSSRAKAAVDPGDLTISPAVSHGAALQAMASADVLVLFTGGGGAGADTMTGKLYEYLALRRPILLVGPPGPAAELVAGSGAGIAADPGDGPSLEAAILAARRMAMDPGFSGAPAPVVARYDRRALAVRWAAILAAVAGDVPLRGRDGITPDPDA